MHGETDSTGGGASTPNITRRRFLQGAGATTAAVALGAGNAAAGFSTETTIDFQSEIVQDPWINATQTVELTEPDMAQLEHINDSGEVEHLAARGFVIASREDDTTPHNPVTLAAGDLISMEDGNAVPAMEFRKFPRGATYDDDSDADTAEVDVVVLDATHWTTDASSTAGTVSISDGEQGSLLLEVTGTAGDTALATFDLSSVASDDMTITSGMSRKFLAFVRDIETLGGTVEYRLIDSTGTSVTAQDKPRGDTSLVDILAAATGQDIVSQVRAGELEDDQGVSLEDIQKLQIAVIDGDATVRFRGINAERESEWEFGTQEYTNSDGELDTQTLTEPSGDFSITGLDTLKSAPFDNVGVRDIEYDVERRAHALESEANMVRLEDSPTGYEPPKVLEHVIEFEPYSAYDLSTTIDNLVDEVNLPGSRFLAVETATVSTALEDWEDVEDTAWTDKSDLYSSVGAEPEIISAVSTSDITYVRLKILLDEEGDVSVSNYTLEDGAAVSGTGSGGGGFNVQSAIGGVMAAVFGLVAFVKRDVLRGLLG